MNRTPTRKHQILKEIFGFDNFRPGQETVIDMLLSGQDALAVMPTGSGKSICFQVPALIQSGITLVISPLVSLMHNQVEALRLLGVAAVTINSSKSRAENIAAWRQITNGQIKLIYLSPERLMSERMLNALTKHNVGLIAVDEAHCISQWGPNFRPEYEALGNLKHYFPETPIAALTATADSVTRADIIEKLFAGSAKTTVLGFDRPNIRITVEAKSNWRRQMLAFARPRKEKNGIIYCLSRKKTEEAAAYLCREGIPALPYHAGMPAEIRKQHQNIFMTETGVVIVATIAFGMGIDKADVRYVFHADLPSSIESYYQEIGRAGRDGHFAEAHMIYGYQDIIIRRSFIERENSDNERRRREYQRLDALLSFCEASECRRQALLTYFGEQSNLCGNCDLCLNPVERIDRTKDAKILMGAIRQTGMIYGANHLIDILCGLKTEKLLKAGHQHLDLFGKGKRLKAFEWKSIILQLVALGLLKTEIENYGSLKITEKGRNLERGLEQFQYRQQNRRLPKTNYRKPRKSKKTEILTQTQSELLIKLKKLRLKLANERNVPAYLIFPDRALLDMVIKMPCTDLEFAEVNGVGSAKLKLFASYFLSVINNASLSSNRN